MIEHMGFLVIQYVDTIADARDLIRAETAGRVVGVYRMPSKSDPVCQGLSTGCREVGWKRHPDGYMVHACGYRNKNYRSTIAVTMADVFGRNMLPADKTPAIFRDPPGIARK